MKLELLACTALLLSVSAAEQTCKTVETVENFNVTEYASAPWYIHQQAVTRYSPIEQNYCTRAQYTISDSAIWGYTVAVNNEAENAGGEQFGGPLCALQQGDSASKLAVAPCFLPPKLFAGPYWVVAYNETEGYALISGGQPTIPGEGAGCRTGTGTNNAGLWIFSRSQERDDELIEKVRNIAETAGFDLSVLNNVVQDGCLYETCVDQEETFSVGFWGTQRNCDWVAEKWTSFRCLGRKEECPKTCNSC